MVNDNFIKLANSFSNELKSAYSGQKSSLPFIIHTLAPRSKVKDGEVFQVIVIGGSFYQKAVMKKVDGKVEILSQSKGAQPPFLKIETLMKFLDSHVDENINVLALNFSYPMIPIMRNDLLDGRLTHGSKENTFTGLEGKVVGEEIESYFKEKHNRNIQVSTANDTICLLLSGLTRIKWANLAAGVVGTGLNFAIFLGEHTVVNLESASFNNFKVSAAAKYIDNISANPGDALYEKEVSGAYLYQHFNYHIKGNNIDFEPIESTKELDQLTKSENKLIAEIAQNVMEHSATLVAAQIAGIMNFQKRDLTFIMQGSLFWKGQKYPETVKKTINDLSPNYNATFEKITNSDLYGAAKLVA